MIIIITGGAMNIALDKYISSPQLIPFYYLMWVVYHSRECRVCVHQEYLLGSTNTKYSIFVDKWHICILITRRFIFLSTFMWFKFFKGRVHVLWHSNIIFFPRLVNWHLELQILRSLTGVLMVSSWPNRVRDAMGPI